MKEQEPGGSSLIQSELTRQPNSPKLNMEGIIMAGENGEGHPIDATNKEEVIRAAWNEAYPTTAKTPLSERRAIQDAIKAGIMPLTGGSGEDEQDQTEDETRPADDSLSARQAEMEKFRHAKGSNRSPEEELRVRRGEIDEYRKKRIATFQKSFEEGTYKINAATEFNQVAEEIDNFIFYTDNIKDVNGEEYSAIYEKKVEKLREMQAKGDLAGIQGILAEKDSLDRDFATGVRSHYLTAESQPPDIPESLEDLAAVIMRTESERWKTGGDRELINAEGKVIKEHVLAWVRKRIIELHDFNPTSTVDFFSSITVKARWSQISFMEMVLTGSYFLEKREESKLEAVGGKEFAPTELLPTYHKNVDYEKLKRQLLMEAYLFQTSRNSHVDYVNVMFNEQELAKQISKLYLTNIFTRDDNFELILSMPSMDADLITDAEKKHKEEGKEIINKLENNFEVGQAVRKLLLSYYYIYDYNKLKDLLGENAPLFAQFYDKIDPDGKVEGVGTLKSEGFKTPGKKYDSDKWYENKKLKLGDNNLPSEEFMQYINVFTAPGPNKDAAIVAEVRERMVQSIMQNMHLKYDEAKYAEAWAFSMTRWTGLGAKNDTGAVGHDAWTKILNSQEYRIRQMAERRNATYGNIFNVLGIKRLGLNLFEGLRTTGGESLIESVQGGEGSQMDLKTAVKLKDKKIRFAEAAMSTFTGNHILNGFALHEFLIDHNGFNFQDFLKFDNLGRVVIDYEKANKMIDGVEKSLRYMWSTWGGTDYSKTVNTWEKRGEKGKIESVNIPILAELFGREILEKLQGRVETVRSKMKPEARERFDKETKDANKELNRKWTIRGGGKDMHGKSMSGDLELDLNQIQHDEVRHYIWKEVFEYLIEAEIESHRNVHSDQTRFNMLQMEEIYAFLRTKNIYSQQETNELRKRSHTTTTGMLLQEGGFMALTGGLGEAFKRIRANLGDLFKTAS